MPKQMKPLPIEIQLWTKQDIGTYLQIDPNKVVQRYASLPDFPKRIELPTAEGKITHPRWKAADVIRWAEGYAQ